MKKDISEVWGVILALLEEMDNTNTVVNRHRDRFLYKPATTFRRMVEEIYPRSKIDAKFTSANRKLTEIIDSVELEDFLLDKPLSGSYLLAYYRQKSLNNNKIKKMRETKGFSQNELAEAVGATQGNVSLWESSKRLPQEETLEKIATALCCKVEELI